MQTLRVVVVDPLAVIARAVAARIDGEPDLRVVATATGLPGALQAVERLVPDVAVVGVDATCADPLDAVRRLQAARPSLAVVMLAAGDDVDTVVDAVVAGAAAWVPKQASLDELLTAVRLSGRGGGWLPSPLIGPVLRGLTEVRRARQREATLLDSLTPREREVLQCLVDGLDRDAVARELFLSRNTVRTHIQNLMAKLDAHSQLDAVVAGIRSGLRPRAGGPSRDVAGLVTAADPARLSAS